MTRKGEMPFNIENLEDSQPKRKVDGKKRVRRSKKGAVVDDSTARFELDEARFRQEQDEIKKDLEKKLAEKKEKGYIGGKKIQKVEKHENIDESSQKDQEKKGEKLAENFKVNGIDNLSKEELQDRLAELEEKGGQRGPEIRELAYKDDIESDNSRKDLILEQNNDYNEYLKIKEKLEKTAVIEGEDQRKIKVKVSKEPKDEPIVKTEILKEPKKETPIVKTEVFKKPEKEPPAVKPEITIGPVGGSGNQDQRSETRSPEVSDWWKERQRMQTLAEQERKNKSWYHSRDDEKKAIMAQKEKSFENVYEKDLAKKEDAGIDYSGVDYYEHTPEDIIASQPEKVKQTHFGDNYLSAIEKNQEDEKAEVKRKNEEENTEIERVKENEAVKGETQFSREGMQELIEKNEEDIKSREETEIKDKNIHIKSQQEEINRLNKEKLAGDLEKEKIIKDLEAKLLAAETQINEKIKKEPLKVIEAIRKFFYMEKIDLLEDEFEDEAMAARRDKPQEKRGYFEKFLDKVINKYDEIFLSSKKKPETILEQQPVVPANEPVEPKKPVQEQPKQEQLIKYTKENTESEILKNKNEIDAIINSINNGEVEKSGEEAINLSESIYDFLKKANDEARDMYINRLLEIDPKKRAEMIKAMVDYAKGRTEEEYRPEKIKIRATYLALTNEDGLEGFFANNDPDTWNWLSGKEVKNVESEKGDKEKAESDNQSPEKSETQKTSKEKLAEIEFEKVKTLIKDIKNKSEKENYDFIMDLALLKTRYENEDDYNRIVGKYIVDNLNARDRVFLFDSAAKYLRENNKVNEAKLFIKHLDALMMDANYEEYLNDIDKENLEWLKSIENKTNKPEMEQKNKKSDFKVLVEKSLNSTGRTKEHENVSNAIEKDRALLGIYLDAVEEKISDSKIDKIITIRNMYMNMMTVLQPINDASGYSLALEGNPAKSPVFDEIRDVIGKRVEEMINAGQNIDDGKDMLKDLGMYDRLKKELIKTDEPIKQEKKETNEKEIELNNLREEYKKLKDEEKKFEAKKKSALRLAKLNPLTRSKAKDYEYFDVYSTNVKAPTKEIGKIDSRLAEIDKELKKTYSRINELEKEKT